MKGSSCNSVIRLSRWVRWEEGHVLAHRIILSHSFHCTSLVFSESKWQPLFFSAFPFKPIIFFYLDELVFTVRQPWCRIHVTVCGFISAMVNVMEGGADHSWSLERGLCVVRFIVLELQFCFVLFLNPQCQFCWFQLKLKIVKGDRDRFMPSEF